MLKKKKQPTAKKHNLRKLKKKNRGRKTDKTIERLLLLCLSIINAYCSLNWALAETNVFMKIEFTCKRPSDIR